MIFTDDVNNDPFSRGTRIVLYADDILLSHTIYSNLDLGNTMSTTVHSIN